jgi:hypothetical protein
VIDRARFAELAAENEILVMEEHENALLGLAFRCGAVVAVYDRDAIVENLIVEGLTSEEAEDHVGYNIEGGWVGENTPWLLERLED